MKPSIILTTNKFSLFSKLILVFFFLASYTPYSFAQVAKMNKFSSYITSNLNKANELMESGKSGKAITKLNDVNRYIDFLSGSDLEDYYRGAKKENSSFAYTLDTNLSNKFTSSYWQTKYKRLLKSKKDAEDAIREMSSLRVLDKQDIAWSYIKIIYGSLKTIKDVAGSVTTQEYYDAFKNAKEGVDGFIDNYKEVEKGHLQKQGTELFEMQTKGLVRRAKRSINAIEPVLSFMKANAEEGDRYYRLKDRVNKIIGKVDSGVAQKMVYGDKKYTWNYTYFYNEFKQKCSDFREYDIKPEALKKEANQIIKQAKLNWKTVVENINNSCDKENRTQYLSWANEAWDDFKASTNKLLEKEIPTNKTVKKPNMFAGASGIDLPVKKDSSSKKPNMFAGLDEPSKKNETSNHKTTNSNPLLGLTENKTKTQLEEKIEKSKAKATGKELGTLLNIGGKTKKNVGGNYVAVPLKDLKDSDIIHVKVLTGRFSFVHIHLRNSRGIWYSIYNGTNKYFKVSELIKTNRSGFTHINFSINGQHVRYLPIACTAKLIKYSSNTTGIAEKYAYDWRSGSKDTPNKFLQKHPRLIFKNSIKKIKPSTTKVTFNSSKKKQSNKIKDTTQSNQSSPQNKDKLKNAEAIKLVSQINGVIAKADKEFNSPYWKQKNPPRTALKAENPKASSLRIMMQAIPFADRATYPENKITLYYQIARKLIEYSRRVFVMVGKREFFIQAAQLINKAGIIVSRIKHENKYNESLFHCKQAEMWRKLEGIATLGGHSYNKNECYKKVGACYQNALRIYPQNYKAKRYFNK